MEKDAKFETGTDVQLSPPLPAEVRDIETITAEIIQHKQNAGNEILAIGNCLIEAKAVLPHGAWLPWLTEQVEFSEATAQRFMKLAREWANPATLRDLGASKALALLALPPAERDAFIEGTHVVNGEEKRVEDMSARELRKALQERDAARQEAENAEARRAKMETDMKALEDEEAKARNALAKAQAELKALRERPMDVAVETVIDEEAIKKAREKAVSEMKAKIDKAEAARKEAENKRKAAEAALADAKKQADKNSEALSRAEKAERDLAETRRKLVAAEKEAKHYMVNSNPDLSLFGILFNQVQETINKMHGLRIKLGANDKDLESRLKNAMNALGDAMKESVK